MKPNKYIVMLFTTIGALVLGVFSISLMNEYGWTLFFLVPVLIGFVPPFVIGRYEQISLSKAFEYSFLTFCFVLLLSMMLGFEGLICIVMAAPIGALAVLLGSYLGYLLSKQKWSNRNISSVIILISTGFLSFDYVNEPTALIPVTTEVIIDAPIEEVWNNVVTFDKIDEPTDWIFSTGIAYPTDATIEGSGVGAMRYCNFTTGSFIEPITKWQEPTLLEFDVVDQPAPMDEFNPFWDIHPKHLDGYFLSHKGQFKLSVLEDGRTKLSGTTWYSVDITPEFYWSMWSDFIIHRIHKRVLNHIKVESEK